MPRRSCGRGGSLIEGERTKLVSFKELASVKRNRLQPYVHMYIYVCYRDSVGYFLSEEVHNIKANIMQPNRSCS